MICDFNTLLATTNRRGSFGADEEVQSEEGKGGRGQWWFTSILLGSLSC